MNNGVGTGFEEHANKPVVLLGQVEIDEADLLASVLSPHDQALAYGADRREGLDFELDIDEAPAQVVDDGHVVAGLRQVQGRRPPAEPVTTED